MVTRCLLEKKPNWFGGLVSTYTGDLVIEPVLLFGDINDNGQTSASVRYMCRMEKSNRPERLEGLTNEAAPTESTQYYHNFCMEVTKLAKSTVSDHQTFNMGSGRNPWHGSVPVGMPSVYVIDRHLRRVYKCTFDLLRVICASIWRFQDLAGE